MTATAGRPLKIGYVWQYEAAGLSPVSATALHIQAVVRALQARSHQVRVLALRQGWPSYTDDLENWHPVQAGPLPRGLQWVERPVRGAQSRLGLPYLNYFESYRFSQAVEVAFQGYDVLYERFWLNGYGALLAAGRMGLPLVYEVNGDLVEEYAQLGIELSALQWKAIHWITRRMFRRAAGVVTVSEVLRERVLHRWHIDPHQVVTVPNGAQVDVFSGASGDRMLSERYGLNGHPAIMFVGSFKPWHGLDLLVEAFSRLAGTHPQARLVFVGDGPERQALEAQAGRLNLDGKVIFTGAVPHEEVAALLSAAEVAVVNPRVSPASISQCPLKLFEYMAAGKAIVAPRAPNLQAILTDGENALLVPPDEPEALRQALVRLLDQADLRRALGEAARRQALERHSWGRTAQDLETIFFGEIPSGGA